MKYIIMTAIAAMGLMSCGSTKQAVLLPLEQAVKTLYNPQSERYDEEGFIAYAQKLLASGADNATKARAATLLADAMKNRLHTAAADFSYKLKDGSSHRLSDIEAEYTVLFFNNPDCEECGEIKHAIAESAEIDALVKAKKLAILGVCPLSMSEEWPLAVYPPQMVNGLDATGEVEDSLYDLRTIPMLYLLDSKKNVVLKNTTLENILNTIR